MNVRETVLRSLAAVGAQQEAEFYAKLFAEQEAETFALLLLDHRCLKEPLFEVLTSALRILSNLSLTPIILVGAIEGARTDISFQAQRLSKELERSGVRNVKFNTESYELINEVRQKARVGIMPVLEMTERRGDMNLAKLVSEIGPRKIIFLQPSGGLSKKGRRVSNLTLEELPNYMDETNFSSGQIGVLQCIVELGQMERERRSYILASPLNLLGELFTIRGKGTLIRRGIKIKRAKTFRSLSKAKLTLALESAFQKPLRREFYKQKLYRGFIESDYRGGALFTKVDGLYYLSKFWVTRPARGEGIARNIWGHATAEIPEFFWRSRMGNPFNRWYMRECDGMQRNGPWRVFWKGLSPEQVPAAIAAAGQAPDDFEQALPDTDAAAVIDPSGSS